MHFIPLAMLFAALNVGITIAAPLSARAEASADSGFEIQGICPEGMFSTLVDEQGVVRRGVCASKL